ncbi:uncharacterized protein BDCG_07983 [Blastomyces dermatitidis ER-3]|uniref:Uncharacterized protein n=1 Tax=Ajellomyces dermatitidis (strain ER-3 / ATCC MYA-2586) TaxID=559297 RepID=A0ABP2ES33_AJEDR|nr:uncharacterized protein BDCG_07983 [Blastomyces dermatitidis ER-3]EEQ84714.2 hypothetical protein BDCG_07983 [Blastomyces dermatitidis ER-3]
MEVERNRGELMADLKRELSCLYPPPQQHTSHRGQYDKVLALLDQISAFFIPTMVNFNLSRLPYVGRFVKDSSYCRCLMLGQDNAGKTTLLHRLQLGRKVDTIPTVLYTSNIETVQVPSEKINITFWDLGGGCSRIPPQLFRYYLDPEILVLFLIDPTVIFCPNDGARRAQDAIEELKFALTEIVGAKYLAVIFTKRDQTRGDDPRVELQISLVKQVLAEHRTKVPYPCELYDDLEQLSAATGAQTDILLTRLARVAKMEEKAMRDFLMKKTAPSPSPKPNLPKLSREELLVKIDSGSKDADNLLGPDEFMRRMVSGDLEKWDHQFHLRAGFLTLTERILRENVVFDAADLFLERLDLMLKAVPGKFQNTSHRTLTIFWLHQIYLAMLSFRERAGSFPAREKFNEFLLENPDLMHGRSWDLYYSKDVLFSPAAKDGWKLPDIRPLPRYISRRVESQQPTTPNHEKNKAISVQYQTRLNTTTPEILKRFSFATLKAMKLTNRRRAAVINETMPVLQSQIIRLRAAFLTTPSPSRSANSTINIDPYSVTQAYFWIQMLHAAIESVPASSGLDIRNITFESFRVLFPELLAEDDIWKQYYTEERWTSIKGRTCTVLPDLKPLPNVLQAPSQSHVRQAVASTLDEKYSYSSFSTSLYSYGRPSVEELFLEVRWAVREARECGSSYSAIPSTHAMLIYRIFTRMLDRRTISLSSAAWDAVSFLHHQQQQPKQAKSQEYEKEHHHHHYDHPPSPQNFTAAVFWSNIVLRAFFETDNSSPFHSRYISSASATHHTTSSQQVTLRAQFFEEFLQANPELCWEGLWRLYYSDELWRSEDARTMYVVPDRRGIPAFVENGTGGGTMEKEVEVELEAEKEKEENVVLEGGWEVVGE